RALILDISNEQTESTKELSKFQTEKLIETIYKLHPELKKKKLENGRRINILLFQKTFLNSDRL
ncbi:hypothetical protein LEP1GSC133_0730, partial [Leptospira borgpetersenii serovar Pomona str. 200901868]